MRHNSEEAARHFREPLPWWRASEAEREGSILTAEQCELVTHDGRYFFIRGLLEIPIKNSTDVFTWGVWCSLSEKSYSEVDHSWDDPARTSMGPYFGWLCNTLPGYPDTLHLKTNVHQRAVGLRPTIELEHTEHPLSIHQREGIPQEELTNVVSMLFHEYQKHGEEKDLIAPTSVLPDTIKMKTIATFANYAEAGFVQSLLHEEGIESFAPDAGSMPNGVFHVPVQVAEADWTRAAEIIARFQAETKSKPDPVADHPATGFPFLGIMGFVALLWMLGTTVWVFFTEVGPTTLLSRLGVSFTAGFFSLIPGLLVGFFLALLCLICRPLFNKLKVAP